MEENLQQELFEASKKSCKKTVKKCIKKGASVHGKCPKSGQCALHYAALYGRPDNVKVLMKRGANANVQRNDGCTALFLAAENENYECCNMLIRYGADVNIADNAGITPLMVAVRDGNLWFVKLLVQNNANLNAMTTAKGENALRLACHGNRTEIVKYLIENGASVNTSDKDGRTPLITAAYFRRLELCKILIENNADVNISTKDGETALLIASKNNDFDCLKLLLEHNAQVNVKTREGMTALYITAEKGYINCLRILLQHQANVNLGDEEDNQTALFIASCNGEFDCVLQLLEMGADVNAKTYTLGASALDAACYYGYTEIAESLINHGALVNSQRKSGATPLLMAAQQRNFPCCKLLVDNKADVNLADNDGLTPLEIAENHGHSEMVKLLIQNNASSMNKKKSKEFPFNTAQTNNKQSIAGVVTNRPRVHSLESVIVTRFEVAQFEESVLTDRHLSLNDTVIVNAPDTEYYGILKWCGIIDGRDCVGVKLTNDCRFATTGIFNDVELFHCKQKRGILIPVHYITSDEKISNPYEQLKSIVLHNFKKSAESDSFLKDVDLCLACGVVIKIKCHEFRGILKWSGFVDYIGCVGIELDDPVSFGTDGIYDGRMLFVAKCGRGVLVPLKFVECDNLRDDSHEECGATCSDKIDCIVCMDRKICVGLIPCQHFCLCESCAAQLDNCPICQTKIKETKKFYTAY